MLKEGVGGECEVDSRTMPAISQQNDGTYSFLQAGQVQSEADLFGSENMSFDFVLECLRTAL